MPVWRLNLHEFAQVLFQNGGTPTARGRRTPRTHYTSLRCSSFPVLSPLRLLAHTRAISTVMNRLVSGVVLS